MSKLDWKKHAKNPSRLVALSARMANIAWLISYKYGRVVRSSFVPWENAGFKHIVDYICNLNQRVGIVAWSTNITEITQFLQQCILPCRKHVPKRPRLMRICYELSFLLLQHERRQSFYLLPQATWDGFFVSKTLLLLYKPWGVACLEVRWYHHIVLCSITK